MHEDIFAYPARYRLKRDEAELGEGSADFMLMQRLLGWGATAGLSFSWGTCQSQRAPRVSTTKGSGTFVSHLPCKWLLTVFILEGG